jgi:excisionase family DNA binding protein
MNTQTPTRHGTVLLSPADAARLAQVSRDTIYREIDRGELPVDPHKTRHLRRLPRDFPAQRPDLAYNGPDSGQVSHTSAPRTAFQRRIRLQHVFFAAS